MLNSSSSRTQTQRNHQYLVAGKLNAWRRVSELEQNQILPAPSDSETQVIHTTLLPQNLQHPWEMPSQKFKSRMSIAFLHYKSPWAYLKYIHQYIFYPKEITDKKKREKKKSYMGNSIFCYTVEPIMIQYNHARHGVEEQSFKPTQLLVQCFWRKQIDSDVTERLWTSRKTCDGPFVLIFRSLKDKQMEKIKKKKN